MIQKTPKKTEFSLTNGHLLNGEIVGFRFFDYDFPNTLKVYFIQKESDAILSRYFSGRTTLPLDKPEVEANSGIILNAKHIGYAFGKEDVFIGSYRDLFLEINNRLNNNSYEEVVKSKLEELLEHLNRK